MSDLVGNIARLSKQKRVPATLVDLLGSYCSVRLSTNGTLLRGLRFLGPIPSVGATVYVDYSTGNPIVYTSADLLPDESGLRLTTSALQNPIKEGDGAPSLVEPSFHNDLPGLQGGLPATESVPAEYYHLTAAEYAALGGGPGGAAMDYIVLENLQSISYPYENSNFLYYEVERENKGSSFIWPWSSNNRVVRFTQGGIYSVWIHIVYPNATAVQSAYIFTSQQDGGLYWVTKSYNFINRSGQAYGEMSTLLMLPNAVSYTTGGINVSNSATLTCKIVRLGDA